ncbi:MAG TPA: HAMP domain-containing sensor histidine kinase [Pirellula sp.]|nr:HAMP domain-containing sensor histidine kinase [Pirellula sp.]
MRLPLISKSTIRKKLLVSMLVLGIVVGVLGYSSFRGVYAYRDLVTTLSSRASEMPLTTELTRSIDELRNGFQNVDIREPMEFSLPNPHHFDSLKSQRHFSEKLHHVHVVLALYKSRLEKLNVDNSFLSDLSDEFEKSAEIAELLNTISIRHQDLLESGSVPHTIQQLQDLERLSKLAHILPTFFSNRMASFRNDVRSGYRTWIALAWSSATLAAFLLIGLIAYARIAVIKPFKELLAGSRRVASGDFAHRIHIESRDELSELADAINLGAASFLSIQRDLNEQVRERSQEVIRNEQLASVGFLAAGVAHEINNPLASIAWSAEALESRLHRILHPVESQNERTPEESAPGFDLDTLRNYLRRIQDEAFRCKGITERLLDFSRLGTEQRKQSIDMNEIVGDVVDMVRHLGQFRTQKIEFQPRPMPMIAWASPQEMKQVVLNLLTNSLESLDPQRSDGCVEITLEALHDSVRLVIEDNGCGMTDEVLQHLFEPFFTRRRDGRGTGLGLPITSRIIADHGGRITPKSQGINCGTRFEVILPNQPVSNETYDATHEKIAA